MPVPSQILRRRRQGNQAHLNAGSLVKTMRGTSEVEEQGVEYGKMCQGEVREAGFVTYAKKVGDDE